jgi:peptidoglycan/LPS O-acetylase OafA/YrhL
MKIEQLTFTRFLAAISIVIFHYGQKSFLFNNNFVGFIVEKADVCVSYFFILSGFVMMIAYADKAFISAKQYLINRLARIYPVYFFAILIMLFLQIRLHTVDYVGLIYNVFMIQVWIPSKIASINPPGWSLCVEMLFYLTFPFIFNKCFRKIRLEKLIFWIVLFWILSQIVFQKLWFMSLKNDSQLINFLMNSPLLRINEFLIGNLAGYLFTEKLKSKNGNYDFLIIVLISFIILALKFSMNLNFHNGLLAVFFIPLIILISLNNGFITKLFQSPSLVFFGEISFGIYILQHPVFTVISAYSVNKYLHLTDATVVFFLRLILLIMAASASYLYIEKPIQNFIKSKRVKVLRI